MLSVRALLDDPPTAAAALGTEIKHPVGALDDFKIVLDNDEGVARIPQLHEHFEELVDIGECKPVVGSSRMLTVRPVAFLASSVASLMRCASPPLRRRPALAEMHVAQADIFEGEQFVGNLRDVAKEARGFIHGHIEHVWPIFFPL